MLPVIGKSGKPDASINKNVDLRECITDMTSGAVVPRIEPRCGKIRAWAS